jgi:hypothetical protein
MNDDVRQKKKMQNKVKMKEKWMVKKSWSSDATLPKTEIHNCLGLFLAHVKFWAPCINSPPLSHVSVFCNMSICQNFESWSLLDAAQDWKKKKLPYLNPKP